MNPHGEEEEVGPAPAAVAPSSASGDGTPLVSRVFCAARDGRSSELCALLAEKSAREQAELLSALTEEDGNQRRTPLMAAAQNGREEVVSALLSKFRPDLSQTGRVRFGGYLIEEASALWCAAGAGRLGVVRALVEAGANINQGTKINSTPLRAACFEGHLEVARYLLAVGADASIANHFNNTCLMIAAFRGHLDVVRLLLDHDAAELHRAAACGATPLHFSAEAGHVAVVEELLRRGAGATTPTEHGVTPAMAAAEKCQVDVVEYMLTRPELSRSARVDALELLGGSLANDRDNYDPGLAHHFLLRGMRERWEGAEPPIPKPDNDGPVVEAYGRRECANLDQVAALSADADALHMEGLAVRERVLGADNPEVPQAIVYRGAVFADVAAFDRCIALWKHAIKLKRAAPHGVGVAKDLLRFAQVFSQMLHVGLHLKFEDLMEITEATAEEIKSNQKDLAELSSSPSGVAKTTSPTAASNGKEATPPPEADKSTLETELSDNMHTFLYLVVLYTRLKEGLSEEQELRAMRSLYQVCSQVSPREPRTGRTLLHLAADSDTPVDDFHTSDVVRFPSAAGVKALLAAGADPGARCSQAGDTPLHRIVAYQRIVSDFATIHGIITDLVGAGAHIDVVNSKGLTPMDCATTAVAEIILKSQAKMSLKCLAAKSVRKHNLSYQGQVPQALETFIELHGP